MEATLTELSRHTERVLRPVLSGREVVITQHGRPVAKLVPFSNDFDRKAAWKALRELGPITIPPR